MNIVVAVWLLGSLVAIAYPIAIYPLLVLLVARLRPRRWRTASSVEPIAHIITVYNEERRIREKLENTLAAASRSGGTEVIVVSDGSDDATESIVREFADRGVRWIGCPRRGKEHAQLVAIRETKAPVLVFSDASTLLWPDSVERLVEPFADPEVAAVSGTDTLDTETGGTGEDLYVRFEMRVRRAESLAGSLVGMSGCFFAARREICTRWLIDVPSDLGTALLAISDRRRAVAADGARCRYGMATGAAREFRRKRRTALRGLRGLLAYRAALWRGNWIERWQVFSHKVMRFAAPLFAISAFAALTTGAFAGLEWAGFLLAGLALIAVVMAAALALPVLQRLKPIRAAGFFALGMAAVAAAWLGLLRRDRDALWAPTERR